MQRGTTVLMTAALIAGLGACASGFKATYDHDPAQDFSIYHSFAWISGHPMKVGTTSAVPNPLLEPRIMSAISDALVAKGYEKVDHPQSADFIVSFTIGSRQEIRVDSYPSMAVGVGRGWRWGGIYYGVGTGPSVRQYTKGMLAIDMFDVDGHRPVWHGVASKSVTEADRKDLPATIRAAVDAILAGFPPQ